MEFVGIRLPLSSFDDGWLVEQSGQPDASVPDLGEPRRRAVTWVEI